MPNNENRCSEEATSFLTSRYAELTDSEKHIVDYLMKNLEASLSMSVYELAKNTGFSIATIVRFAQHMGFDGYKSFRLHLAQCRMENEDYFLDFPTNSSENEQASKVIRASSDALLLTAELLDYETLKRAAGAIAEAKQLLFFATGTSYIVSEDATLKYQRSGKTAFCANDIYSAALVLANFSEKDILIVISHSGENKTALSVLQAATEMGIPTLAITTFKGSPIANSARMVLYTQTRESPLHQVSITSRMSQLAVLDGIYMSYLAIDHQKCLDHNEHLNHCLGKLGLGSTSRSGKPTTK